MGTVVSQCLTTEFLLLVYTVAAGTVYINYVMGTLAEQLNEMKPDSADHLTAIFNFLLPTVDILYIPLVGFLIDKCGIEVSYCVLWLAFLLHSCLWSAFASTGSLVLAYISFAVFIFCRPLFYTLLAAFL